MAWACYIRAVRPAPYHKFFVAENAFKRQIFRIQNLYDSDKCSASIYGAYAFVKRDISSYLFLKNQFVFFDFGQPKLWFFADFTSMICRFACVGAVISKGLKMLDKLKSNENKDGQTKRN